MIEAAEGPLKGVLGVNAKPLVSTDFNHDPLSSIFDLERHPGGRRHVLPRRVLVRQRMGLLQPHERHGRRHGAADMNELASPPLEADTAGGLDLSRVRTIDGVDVRGKRVLIRVDFNVPIEGGVVADADPHHARLADHRQACARKAPR